LKRLNAVAELLLIINKSFLRLGIFLKNLKIKAGYYPAFT